jgi:putative cardiolipin synthase
VHSAYSSYRKDILEAGVELWEARADAVQVTAEDGQLLPGKLTLHTKGIIVDRDQVFVGSLNLDPRSIDINTEMGVLVDSADMAESLAVPFMEVLPERAYRVFEDENGNLRWKVIIDGEEIVENSEPQSGNWRRFKAFMSRILPESQL